MTTTTTNTPDLSETEAPWQPSKPESEYDDAALQATPIFQRLSKLTGLPAANVLPFARQAVRDMWAAIRQQRFSPVIEAIFAAFDGAKEAVGDEVIITRKGTFRPVKKTAASAAEGGRFKAADYARFIGKNNNNPKARHGGFIHEVTQSKQAARNGVYELVIEPGIAGNKVTSEFCAKLYQYPSNGAPLPVICFPPLKGERKEHRAGQSLRADDKVVEVASMSGMMKASILGHPQTPAVTFKLMELLRKDPAAAAASAASADSADVEDEEDDSNAASVLGDDDEVTTSDE